MAKKISVGIDLGGTKIMAVIFDKNFNVLGSERVPTEGHKGSKDGLKRILNTVNTALESAGLNKDEVVACGIGCPGVVDFSNGVLREASNLGWEDVEIGRYLSKKLDAEVVVLNDVDAGTYGEYHLGAAQGAHSVFGVFPGTGVGGGFVYDGKNPNGKNCLRAWNLEGTGCLVRPSRENFMSPLLSKLFAEDLGSRLLVLSKLQGVMQVQFWRLSGLI